MLKIFYGSNRLMAEKAIKKVFGGEYEVFEGEALELTDLPSIFRGASLFEIEKRRILLKEVGENTAVWEKIVDYADTGHEVIIWEQKLDKRSAGYKRLKDAGVEMQEFPDLKKPEERLVFNILDTAMCNGVRAVKMVEQIELIQDPYMFFGLMVTQALKKFEASCGGRREQALIKMLAKLDLQMKTSSMEPWSLVKGFLLQVERI